jgi:hypothetical protein
MSGKHTSSRMASRWAALARLLVELDGRIPSATHAFIDGSRPDARHASSPVFVWPA